MAGPCRRPTLIIEGPGDGAAIPKLMRKICEERAIFELWPEKNPIMRQNIPKLSRMGDLEKYVEYGLRRDGDGVLVVLDTDEHCPKVVADLWVPRIRAMAQREKRVALAFFKSEFESMFLCCLDHVVEQYPDYGWDLNGWEPERDHERVVGAKGALSRRMRKGRAYKETRDQVGFVSALDFARLRDISRSFRHFESTLLWLVGDHEEDLLPSPE